MFKCLDAEVSSCGCIIRWLCCFVVVSIYGCVEFAVSSDDSLSDIKRQHHNSTIVSYNNIMLLAISLFL